MSPVIFTRLVFLFCLSNVAYSAELSVISDVQDRLRGSTLDLGIATKRISLDVSDQNDVLLGGMVSESSVVPYFNYGTQYTYFGETNVGYNIQYSFSPFSLSRQETKGGEVDLGTSVKGYYFYATPVFFYNFGDKLANAQGGSSFKAGVGTGAGYMRAKGDIMFTEQAPPAKSDFDINGENALTLAIYVLFEYRYRSWVFRAHSGGPIIFHKGYEYQFFDTSIDIGYAFIF